MRVLLCLLLMTGLCYAQELPLTDPELVKVRAILARVSELKALADNLGSETIPLDLEILEAERNNLIAQKDAELNAQDVINDGAKQTISDTWQVSISAKEGEIAAKRAELELLIP